MMASLPEIDNTWQNRRSMQTKSLSPTRILLLYAFGLWRRLHPGRGGTWGPILIGAYGLFLVLVGIFRTDPANGFPPGVPAVTAHLFYWLCKCGIHGPNFTAGSPHWLDGRIPGGHQVLTG